MYNYTWDPETGGYLLDTKVSGVTKELRPVFHEELDLLGMNEYWQYEPSSSPLLWAETRRYFYKGELVAEVNGGGLYTKPTVIVHKQPLKLKPVDLEEMLHRNSSKMSALVQYTVELIYNKFNDYKDKVDVVYVAFSGGKDSIVLLDLVQKTLPHDAFRVVFADTTMEISDTYKAVEKVQNLWPTLDFHIAKCHMDAKETWKLFGPPGRVQRWCCGVHKSVPSILELRKIVGSNKLKAFVFDGVRAEESDARAAYAIVSEGKKHATQINCSPIHNWATTEIFLYILGNKLMINNAYRQGAIRVGCALCPMSSQWWEFIANKVYPDDLRAFVEIIESNAKLKIDSAKEAFKYIDEGGWKGRMGGRDTINGGNRLIEQLIDNKLIIRIDCPAQQFKEWLKALCDFSCIDNEKYILSQGQYKYELLLNDLGTKFEISIEIPDNTKETIRFIYLLKNICYKTAYCVQCKLCMVECPTGALKLEKNIIRINEACIHCHSCIDMQKGCLVAKSLCVTMGGNKMNLKGINRYQHFGFRKNWVQGFFELKNEFWSQGNLGKYQFDGFKVWVKEAELTINNAYSPLAAELERVGIFDIKTWAIILINIAYNSTIVRWYSKNVDFGVVYTSKDLLNMLGDELSVSTRENAITSLKETFRYSPIGNELGVGICDISGNSVVSITREAWQSPDPLVILYSLYKFAEKCGGHYGFTLSYLCDDSVEREGLSPTRIFGISPDVLKEMLVSLSRNHAGLISVDFQKDLDNIDLHREITSLDVLKLL